jgi:hypothetical protein
MLTPALFFTSRLGLGVWLMIDKDVSLRSGRGHESDDVLVCSCADQGILDGDPAHRRPALDSGQLQPAAA